VLDRTDVKIKQLRVFWQPDFYRRLEGAMVSHRFSWCRSILPRFGKVPGKPVSRHHRDSMAQSDRGIGLQSIDPLRTIRRFSDIGYFLSLFRLLNFSTDLAFLIGLGIIAELAGNGDPNTFLMLIIPVAAFPSSVDKASLL
jgi:hypothetical protein